jgi:hypothetical protein
MKHVHALVLVSLECQMKCKSSYINFFLSNIRKEENIPSCHDDEKVVSISLGIDIQNRTP